MIRTVKILKSTPHPNAHSLKICIVSDGNEESKVVCGAKNTYEGMITILAGPGDKLPSGTELKVANLRGEDSFGMLCSPKDLSIQEESGIVDLPESTELGLDYHQIPRHLISSTPWYNYQLVDNFWRNQQTQSIIVTKDESSPGKNFHLISQTYYNEGNYLYRNF